MKKHCRTSFKIMVLILGLMGLMTLVLPRNVKAEESEEPFTWNSSVYHVSDGYGVLDDEDKKAENAENDLRIQEAQCDFSVLISGTEKRHDASYEEYLETLFTQNNMGYGANRDGIFMGMDPDAEEFCLYLNGRTKSIFTREKIDELVDLVQRTYQEEGYLGAIHAYTVRAYEIVMESEISCEELKDYGELPYGILPVSMNTSDRATYITIDGQPMPTWFEVDETFVSYHNKGTEPRVIDNADLLTDDQERILEEKLTAIRETTNQDIVLMTDNTSYGLDNELYEMSFYVYQGYGIGEEYDGLMCFINMDPDNREMCSTAFGTMQEYFTQKASNALDDILYDHLVEKDYFDGFMSWAEAVETLLIYGDLNVPVWYRNYKAGTPSVTAEDKLVTEVGGISAEDKAKLNARIADIAEEFGCDIVVYIGSTANIMAQQGLSSQQAIDQYLDLYYEAGGFGFGQDHSGILLGIFNAETSGEMCTVRTYGAIGSRFDQQTWKKLADKALLNLSEGDYEYNVNRYLSNLEKLLKNGKLPKSFFWKVLGVIVSLISGVYTAYYRTERQKARHVTVKEETNADAYLVRGSFKVLYSQDIYEYSTTERFYSPVKTSSGGSSSSSSSSHHTSSYGHSSHSVGGRSGTTSRRKF